MEKISPCNEKKITGKYQKIRIPELGFDKKLICISGFHYLVLSMNSRTRTVIISSKRVEYKAPSGSDHDQDIICNYKFQKELNIKRCQIVEYKEMSRSLNGFF